MTAPSRILILKPSSLGDVVHALPLLAALRRSLPGAHVAWLVGTSFAPLLEGHPQIDEVIPFDRARFGRLWRSPRVFLDFWAFVIGLRRRRFDLVIDLQGLIRSGIMAWFSGARRRVGFADARELAWVFYTQRLRCPSGTLHAVDRIMTVAAALGLEPRPIEFPLAVTSDEREAAARRLAEAAGRPVRSFAAVLPGARWESKRWPVEKWSALVGRIESAGLGPCVLLGAPDEREAARRIVAACAAEAPDRAVPIDLTGRTSLRELTALLDLAARVVCSDSGPMHVAAALGKPIVAIFGPTDPKKTGPYGVPDPVAALALPCAPCLRRVCPLGHHDCMRRLEVEDVFRRVGAAGIR